MDNMENNFLEGNGIIILLLFFLMFGWGGSGFGGFNNAAAQGALTRAELSDGFNMSELQRNQSDIKEAICGVNQNIMQSRYDSAIQAQNTQYQMSQCCCDIKNAIATDGALTRSMIQQQTIDDLKQQLSLAQNAVANATQTQNILNTLGRFVANPPVNPYTCYGGCNC